MSSLADNLSHNFVFLHFSYVGGQDQCTRRSRRRRSRADLVDTARKGAGGQEREGHALKRRRRRCTRSCGLCTLRRRWWWRRGTCSGGGEGRREEGGRGGVRRRHGAFANPSRCAARKLIHFLFVNVNHRASVCSTDSSVSFILLLFITLSAMACTCCNPTHNFREACIACIAMCVTVEIRSKG